MIVTDTPNKAEIEAEYHTRMDMKRKKEERLKARAKKNLFINKPTQGEMKIKTNKNTFVESETSESDMTYSSESEEELALPVEIDICKLGHPKAGEWIVVKFCVKKTVRRFAGTVVESRNSSDELTLKFARRLDERRFKWPEKDDIADVYPDQVEAVLNPPIFYFKKRTWRIS